MMQENVLIKRGKFTDCAIIEHKNEQISKVICFEEVNYQVTHFEKVNNIMEISDIRPLNSNENHREKYLKILLKNTQKGLIKSC